MWNKEHNGEKSEFFCCCLFVFLMEGFTGTDYLSRKQDHVSHVTVMSVGSHQERGSRVEPFVNNLRWK